MKQFLVIFSVFALAYGVPSPKLDVSSDEECFRNLSINAFVDGKIEDLEQDLKDYKSSGQVDLYYLYVDTTTFYEEVLFNIEECNIPGFPRGQKISDFLNSKNSECVVKKAKQGQTKKSFVENVESLVQTYRASNEFDSLSFSKLVLSVVKTFFHLDKDECNDIEGYLNGGYGNSSALNITDCFSLVSGGAYIQEAIEHLDDDLQEINSTGIVDLDHLYYDVADVLVEVLFALGDCKQNFFPTGQEYNDFINSKNSTCLIEKAAEKNQNEVLVSNIKDFVDDYYDQNYQLQLDNFSKFMNVSGGFFFGIGDACNATDYSGPISAP